MTTIILRLDITAIFCEVDDLCQGFEQHWQQVPQLPSMLQEKRIRSRMQVSEVMTIVIVFHGSGFRTFKDFYTLCVLPHWRSAFPKLVSYSRFIELMPRCLMKKNMKQRLVKLIDKILLRKRALIESVNDQLKNICQIEHSRHRSVFNFLVNLIAGLTAYIYQPKKPALDLEFKGLTALPSAVF
jgi:hypothetical protein